MAGRAPPACGRGPPGAAPAAPRSMWRPPAGGGLPRRRAPAPRPGPRRAPGGWGGGCGRAHRPAARREPLVARLNIFRAGVWVGMATYRNDEMRTFRTGTHAKLRLGLKLSGVRVRACRRVELGGRRRARGGGARWVEDPGRWWPGRFISSMLWCVELGVRWRRARRTGAYRARNARAIHTDAFLSRAPCAPSKVGWTYGGCTSTDAGAESRAVPPPASGAARVDGAVDARTPCSACRCRGRSGLKVDTEPRAFDRGW